MSGRIRTIKPELLDDAVTAGLSDMAFRLFVSSIVLADDYGRLRAEPAWLMGQIYWTRTIHVEAFTAALGELAPLVLFYSVNGQRYAEIRNWAKHQKVSHPGKPRVPTPPENLPRVSGEPPESLVPDLRSPISDQGSPTPTKERPRVSPDDSTPFATGTASGMAAKAEYESAVAEATNAKFGLPRAPFHLVDLCDLLNTFAEGSTKADKLAWLRQAVTDWVNATDGKSTAGWLPNKLQNWLNGGRPSARVPIARGAEVTKQGFDPNAPWMKLGEAG